MGLKRRAFLQQAGLTLFALGSSEAALSLVIDRYQQALAQPTNRKLALLVGINQYPEQVSDRSTYALNGCITDVQLQRELLIHRFGFQPSDILTLTDQQVTREAIEAAFLTHLTEQARPGDVVLFHFSGFGSQIKLGENGELVQNSLVPVDGVLPTEESPYINDLPEETLGLLLRSLSTEQVTAVLDTSYADPNRAIQGNLRVRSRPTTPNGWLAPAELEFQAQLRGRVRISQEQSQSQWRTGQLPGIVLMATGPNQVAAEGQWNGFSAGLFTYALTQHLWGATPASTLQLTLGLTAGSVEQLVGKEQQPYVLGQKSQNPSLSPYYLKSDATTTADGVVTAIEEDGKTVRLWLAGLPAAVLENYGQNSLLSLVPSNAQPGEKIQLLESVVADVETTSSADKQLLQIRSREGISVRARISAASSTMPLQVGQLVQESVRVLPRNINLTVALDSSLERIERVDATSAFATIPRVTAIAAGEQSADYVFGKTQLGAPTLAASLTASSLEAGDLEPRQPVNGDLPAPKSSYGLFHLGRSALLNTLSKEEEAVKTAVNRITPQLHTLLAAKLLRLTSNAESSRLGVRATLEMTAPQERIVMQQETPRAPWAAPASRLAGLFVGDGKLPTLPINSRLQYRLCNYSDRPVYFILLGLDSSGNAIALFPTPTSENSLDFEAAPADSLLSPGEILLIPQSTPSDWTLQGPPGVVENYVIFSHTPLTHTYSALEISMRSKGDARRVSTLANPLEVAQATLRDLNQASLVANSRTDVPPDTYTLNCNNWATLNFVYQVAKA
ncbi:caspase family protein [Leptolyngbya sp. FACHB-671]|uniref:caspase family protein n=1 Tax=Leptolyngbya sp. FACHB-671 TaxID=2692812 RepID=UPI0016876FEC|nr:caspase family protein [Cyanobacteria bacterium FACHB-471]MBD2071540.1 caspase family protein [Leptolyngbya sp. FACHB-671]